MQRYCFFLIYANFNGQNGRRWTIWHENGQIGRDLGLGTFIASLRVKTQLRILRQQRKLRKLR